MSTEETQAQTAQGAMAGRVVRFSELQGRGIPLMFIDSILPGHQRMNYALIGDTASEDDAFEPLVTAPHGFQVGMVKAKPGNGPAYHTHDYIEAFMPMTGQWRFYWGENADKVDGETVIGPWDLITLPPKLWRGFENIGDEDAWLLSILEEHKVFASKDPYWAPQVEAEAKAQGFYADPSGKMIKPENFSDLEAQMRKKLDGRPS